MRRYLLVVAPTAVLGLACAASVHNPSDQQKIKDLEATITALQRQQPRQRPAVELDPDLIHPPPIVTVIVTVVATAAPAGTAATGTPQAGP